MNKILKAQQESEEEFKTLSFDVNDKTDLIKCFDAYEEKLQSFLTAHTTRILKAVLEESKHYSSYSFMMLIEEAIKEMEGKNV